MLDWIDSEISAAMKRIERVIDRKIHFAARSAGQKKRWAKPSKHDAFKFRLATALGKTVAQLYADLSPAEMEEWIAFYSTEPRGGIDDARRAA